MTLLPYKPSKGKPYTPFTLPQQSNVDNPAYFTQGSQVISPVTLKLCQNPARRRARARWTCWRGWWPSTRRAASRRSRRWSTATSGRSRRPPRPPSCRGPRPACLPPRRRRPRCSPLGASSRALPTHSRTHEPPLLAAFYIHGFRFRVMYKGFRDFVFKGYQGLVRFSPPGRAASCAALFPAI